VNLTDPDATVQKGRGGYLVGYNAQAVVAGTAAPGPDEAGGLLIVAADVTADRDDHGQLVPMLERAREATGAPAGLLLADGGYHSGENLAACEERGQAVAMPDPQAPGAADPYHKDAFAYDAGADTFTCPRGQVLRFLGLRARRRGPPARRYGGVAAACRACPAFGACTRSRARGREVKVSPAEAALRRHRAFMATDEAKAAYRRRKTLPEPAFGILKEQQGARRLLLRGLDNVRAEWSLLATAFNLRALCRAWQRAAPAARPALAGAAAN
jgi:transposase